MQTDQLNILILQSGFLGDAVLASGLIRGLRSVVPDSRIGLAVRAGYAELFTGHPGLHRVHPFDKHARGGTADLAASLRAESYHAALIPHRSLRSAWVVLRSGIRRRVGFRQSDAPWLLTDRVEYDLFRHELDRNAALAERLAGIPVPEADRACWLVPDQQVMEHMRTRFCADGLPVVLIAPGSVWPTKQWTQEGYTHVAAALRDAGYRVLIAGSAAEGGLCAGIASGAGLPSHHVLAGKLTLRELLGLIALSERVLTNDSAPLHLAESVGVPVTAVFGPTVPAFGFGVRLARSVITDAGPLPCRPCGIHGARQCPTRTHQCMRMITPQAVLETIL